MSNRKVRVNWDKVWVHGGHPDTKYIRWKDNLDALTKIAPDLRKAYQVRNELYLAPFKNVQLQIISFLRGLIAKKKGVPRGT